MNETTAAHAPQATADDRLGEAVRRTILAKPDHVLEDRELMAALVDAKEAAQGENIVDLRGVAMERLETRLSRLEDTHNSVLTAAYENLAGTAQIQRAILRLLEPETFSEVLETLESDIAVILRVDAVALVLEADGRPAAPIQQALGLAAPGTVDAYLAEGRRSPLRQVTLRPVPPGAGTIWGTDADLVRSEACLRLDLGPDRSAGLLALGVADPDRFTPAHGTDLLAFFGGVFERALRRWLVPDPAA